MGTEAHTDTDRRLLPTLLGVALVAALISCAPASEEGAEADGEMSAARAAEVETAMDDFVAAWEREDVDATVAFFTADAVLFDPVPPGKFEGSEAIRALVAGAFEELDAIEITLTERNVRTAGRVAWFHARFVYAGQPPQPDAAPVRDEGFVTMIWVRQEDGSYRSPLFHASRLPEEGNT